MNKKNAPTNSRLSVLATSAAFIAFFSALFLYILRMIEPVLLYERFNISSVIIPFEESWTFLSEFLLRPGGPVEYLTSYLFIFFENNLAATIIITALAVLLWFSVRMLFKTSGSPWPGILAWVPTAAMIIPFARYDYTVESFVSLAICTLTAAIFIKVAPCRSVARIIIYVLAFSSLYYAFAAYAFAFAVFVIMREFQRNIKTATAFLIAALVITYLILSLPIFQPIPPDFTVFSIVPKWANELSKNALITAPAFMAAILLLTIVFVRKPAQKKKKRNKQKNSLGWLKPTASAIIVISACAVSLHYAFQPKHKTSLKTDYLTRQGKWNELIACGQKDPYLFVNPSYNHNLNLALYHKGRFETDLFKYPQDPKALTLEHHQGQKNRRLSFKAAQLILKLGYVNDAEKKCYELLESAGNWPDVIETLGLVNLAKDQTITADNFLKKLSHFPSHTEKAQALLNRKQGSQEAKLVEKLQSRALCNINLKKLAPNADNWFEWLLAKDPTNEMAFKYMMAHYLLTKQTNKITQHIHRLKDFGRAEVPRNYQEAIVLEIARSGNDNVVPSAWRPSDKSIAVYRRFLDACSRFKNSKQAKQALAQQYGNTYYYYHTFDLSGVGKW
ncbi:hypothetical protein STSP2_03073 [Anaerohalosphaera lusitana]|uniref:Uncharacterized protein n=1 Tax=Anaerohalosphaera lusitana TaxID=1936003 RepID=A0A1U9NPN4_9BACT|nr:DUF6057 family protein [Anaerohalosphaera lusitana]AQT69873.1 hypothetical protein STSP2_03073 [Anaerohalosphaera lusitana]